MSEITEEWRPVVGYEAAYEVSDMGRVRSLDRLDGIGRRKRGQILSLAPKSNGYLVVTLGAGSRNAKKVGCVHVLVAAAFLGPRPLGRLVCHNDGSRTNNRVTNLRYGTGASNTADAVKHGSQIWAAGEACSWSKLTNHTTTAIRTSLASETQLAVVYGVSRSQIGRVRRRENWAHV